VTTAIQRATQELDKLALEVYNAPLPRFDRVVTDIRGVRLINTAAIQEQDSGTTCTLEDDFNDEPDESDDVLLNRVRTTA
jgi:hypothetical protein